MGLESILLSLLVGLLVLFVIDYIVRTFIPDARIVMVVRLILAVIALIWLLRLLGVFTGTGLHL